jgi:hypothetical protein
LQSPEGNFLNGFSRLREKLAPTLVLDLALFAPRREVGTYSSFKKLGLRNQFYYRCIFQQLVHRRPRQFLQNKIYIIVSKMATCSVVTFYIADDPVLL